MIPPIWLIELTRIGEANAQRSSNSTSIVISNPIQIDLDLDNPLNFVNNTLINNLPPIVSVNS